MLNLGNSAVPQFDKAGNRGRAARQQVLAEPADENAVVRNESREPAESPRFVHACESESGLSYPRRADKKETGGADNDRRSMDVDFSAAHCAASTGSDSVKRAPCV